MKKLNTYIVENSNTKKYLVFDMDGTIADLYAQEDWLEKLNNKDVSPFINAPLIYSQLEISKTISKCKANGWNIFIITYGPKNHDNKFLKEVTNAKLDWLKKYKLPYDNFICTRWGIQKWEHIPKDAQLAILVDDDKQNRLEWTSQGDKFMVIDASRRDFLGILQTLE